MKTISIKRIYLLTIALVAVAMCASAAPTAYAEFNGETLTFKYGEKPTGDYVWDVSDTGEELPMWQQLNLHKNVKSVVFDSSFVSARPKSCYHWFEFMYDLESISNIEFLNTSQVTSMKCFFRSCRSLTSIDVTGFNTSNVTNMSGMFDMCYDLQSVNVSGFNTSKVKDMTNMFSQCVSLTSIDVSHFDTSNVTIMQNMFSWCSSLTSIDVGNFNISNVWNTSRMFQHCAKLTTIYCDEAWIISNSTDMFYDCIKLKGAIKYDKSMVDASYANPTNGYFTYKESYDLLINDQLVRRANCNDLSVLSGVSGTISYNPHNKTLTLQDATITNTAANTTYNNNSGYGILNMIDGLTIKIEGDNTITSEQWDGLASVGNLTITGNGTLNINAKGTSLDMIGETSYYLNITDSAKVFAKGMYGVYGGIKTVPVAGGQLTESYVTHLCVSGEKTELHVFGTEQCAKIIAFLEMDDNMEMRGESGKAYFEQNSFCYFERHRYQPYVNQWVTIRYASVHGDVNRDRSITMADANMVVNYFLSTDKPEDFDLRAADVNGDGEITMADANQIVNMFLAQ